MELLRILTLWALLSLSYAFKGLDRSDGANAVASDIHQSSTTTLELNPSQFLESTRGKPGFFAAAMLEIKRLEEKPICHKMAAQLLVTNCHGLKDLGVHEYQVASEGMQRNHVESFAASLAMCDMERARFDIPEACGPFRSHALDDALRGSGKLNASPDDISSCLQSLGQDHSHWSTWLSYRDTSLLLCRGASVDVEKGQAIKQQKLFVKMMEEFSAGLNEELEDLRRQMAAYARESEAHYREARNQAEQYGENIHATFETVSQEVKNANSALKSIATGTNDAYRMIRNLVATMVQSNAAMAAEQEHAVSVSTNKLKSSLGDIDDMVTQNKGRLINLQDFLEQVATGVSDIFEKQNAIEKSSLRALTALVNVTELVQSHEQKLNQASLKASQISENLERVSSNAQRLDIRGSRLDWLFLTITPIITLVGGNFRTIPSTAKNLFLLSLGYALGETINIIRHRECDYDWTYYIPNRLRRFTYAEEDVDEYTSSEEPKWKGRIIMPKLATSPTSTTNPEVHDDHFEMI